ncbi:MAG TPA: DUF2027 domain-containing protein [Bacteroidia bacterium]|nr:DUF2027 domain-containing protein [Bacteroidia bacterium]HNS13156.1 DUF2027 domain-containing protein [Bacteroidia bacterium]
MKFKEHDKVRFLNDAVEGVVTRILPNGRIEVTDNDGFAHVVPNSSVVRIEFSIDSSQIEASETQDRVQQSESEIIESIPPDRAKSQNLSIISSMENDETIYVAVRLHNEKALLTTDIDLLLVNNTSYAINFTAARQFGNLRHGIGAATINARNEKFLGIFSQDELHRFNGFEFQFLFFGEQEYRPRSPVTKYFYISSNDFLHPDYQTRLQGRSGEILLMPLYELEQEQAPDISGLVEKYKNSEMESEKRRIDASRSAKVKGAKEKFVILSRQKVVDLHIEELLKDPSGLSNAQIISYQLNQFMYEMDQAIINQLHKITFIHGVGEGILKNAIREELKKYPGVRWTSAPPEKFGYGATEIEL